MIGFRCYLEEFTSLSELLFQCLLIHLRVDSDRLVILLVFVRVAFSQTVRENATKGKHTKIALTFSQY
jgi:hypothetical protein